MKFIKILPLLLLCHCTENIFDEIADKDTEEAVYFQAKMEINGRNFAEAITLLESLDPTFLANTERAPVYASAYSGRCGLEFLTLLQTMQNQGASTFFGLLMGAFPGAAAANVQDCIDAEDILQGIGDETEREGDANLLAAFNALAKIGTILSSLADTDDDGAADAAFEQCDIANDDLPEAMVRQVGASMGVIITSLAAIGTDYIDSAVSDIAALCAPPSPPELVAVCNKTEPGDFTAQEVRFLRYVLGSNDIGIDSCAGGGNDTNACAAIYEPPGIPECF